MDEVRPSRKLFIIPIVLLIIGITCSIAFSVGLVRSVGAERHYLHVPGENIIAISQPGTVEIYYEYRMYQLDQFVEFNFLNTGTNEVAVSRPVNYGSTYTINNRSGELIAKIDLPSAGEYLVTTTYTGNNSLDFLVGTGVVSGLLVGIFGIAFGGLMPIIASIILFVVFQQKRKQNQRRLQENPYRNDVHPMDN